MVGREARAVEREHCCDDLAVQACGDRLVYARALTSLEEFRGAEPEFAMAATGGELSGRIRRLFGARQPSRRVLPFWLVAVFPVLLSTRFCEFAASADTVRQGGGCDDTAANVVSLARHSLACPPRRLWRPALQDTTDRNTPDGLHPEPGPHARPDLVLSRAPGTETAPLSVPPALAAPAQPRATPAPAPQPRSHGLSLRHHRRQPRRRQCRPWLQHPRLVAAKDISPASRKPDTQTSPSTKSFT